MTSIMLQTDKKSKARKTIYKIAILLFWTGVWQCACFLVDMEMLVPSPMNVLIRITELIKTAEFWQSSLYSLLRITAGYILAVVSGTVLGILTSASDFLYELFRPIISLVRSTPVASIILLALVWLKKDNVAVFISFLMALPVIWTNVSQGIKETDKSLLEMSEIFKFSFIKKVKLIYAHSVLPYFVAGSTTALGLAWKSGIAAEVISTPLKSIGYNLYRSKINIETTDLFAWTVVVILLSVAFEKLIVYLARSLKKKKTQEEKSCA